jgi:hypothetical protein
MFFASIFDESPLFVYCLDYVRASYNFMFKYHAPLCLKAKRYVFVTSRLFDQQTFHRSENVS